MFRSTFLLAMLCIVSITFCTVSASPQLMDKLVKQYTYNTKQHLAKNGTCTTGDLVVREEWGNLNRQTRLDYIRAVKCLARLPSKFDPAKAPGARSRYDDFEASHIIETPKVHATGSFLPWHRRFVKLYETALREECGYSGYQPYWDWAKYAELSLKSNPLIDGSATSLSGNGKYIPNRNGTLQPLPVPLENPPALFGPPGTGGGYIFEGPLVDWQLHLGPGISLANVKNAQPVNPNPRSDGLGYNPRRMIRDFNNTLLLESNTYAALTSMITNMTDIHTFQPYLFTNPHTAGHLFISGYDNDLWTSPGDPLFWFHHAQLDRIWSIWQAQDFSTREYAIDGTLTLLNLPPSRNATIDDMMHLETYTDIPIRNAMSPTTDGSCYIYK